MCNFNMAFSLISGHGRGLILPNENEALENSAGDVGEDVIEEASDFLDQEEKEIRFDENQKEVIFASGEMGNNENNCTVEVGGHETKLMSNEADEDICEGKKGSWHAFLVSLYNKFSEYAMQKDRQKYNVADLDNWGKPGKPQGISVTSKTFKKFLDKIGSYNVTEFETIKKQNTTDLQIEELNNVLNLTLNHKPTILCPKPYVIVKDSFLSLSETMQNLISNSNTDKSCSSYKTELAAGKYNLFKFFALNTVFIDADMSFPGKGISVAIIVPNWEVVGSRTIDLSGSDGTKPAQPKAKDGDKPGSNGDSGIPGNPGVSGETYFAIGDTFVGGKNLKIISNGGKGGLGQNGGDGAVGVPGLNAPTPSKNSPECKNHKYQEFRCEYVKEKSRDNINRYTVKIVSTYEIYGQTGGTGASGGDGGKGGKAGNPGSISLLELSQSSEVAKVASKGKEGDNGKGGKGGPGGENGSHTIADFAEEDTLIVVSKTTYWEGGATTKKDTGKGPGGKNGTDGGNAKDIKDPVPAKGINRLSRVVNEYNFFLRENLSNRFQKCILLKFFHLLESSKDVRKLYDVFGLIEDFLALEEQYPNLGGQIEFLPFYSSLQERISEFAKSQKDIKNDNKKVLNYLYTATLGRINNLKENSKQNLIIDMRKYLSMVEENIKTLEDIKKLENKVDVVNKYKDDYKKGFDQKIEEAKSLIDKQITPEIDDTNAKIDENVNSLIEETIALEKEAEKEKEKLKKKKEELERAMRTKGIFNIFKIIGGAASLMGPAGEIAGAVMDVASNVAEPLALSDQDEVLKIPSNLESSLTTLNEQIQKMSDKKVEYLHKILDDFLEEVKKNPDKLGDMKKKVEGMKATLEKVTSNEVEFKCVGSLEKEFKKIVKEKGVELKKHTGDKKSGEAMKVIETMNKVFQFGSLFSDIHDKMKDDQEKMDTLTQSMEEENEKIEALQEYEQNIYVTIAPMLREMEDHMKDIKSKLGTKSHVALDVTKWQVQTTLRDMKLQMQQLTEDHGVKDDLSRNIEKLEEVLTTLINVYDRIQSYQDQKNLANYIADISSVAASKIDIKDQKLVNATNHLEFAIRANIVLQEYKSAVDALEQWVFPFADSYIEKSMLPSQLQLEKNLENLVHNATDRIKQIENKLKVYDSSIKKGDENLECEEFSSEYVSSQPFYVWKNEEHRKSISNLLSGKEVVWASFVKESPPYKDAIKFSEIDFVFKIKNETAQSALSQILKGFDMRATHMGNSYYRYKNNITLINSDSVTISYSYEKNKAGEPIRSNEVYDRLKSGDLLLSPYTLWEVSLINRTDKYSYKDLEKFENDTYVELSGLGSYVDMRVNKFATSESYWMENNAILSFYKPKGAGLNECKRSNSRSVRSVSEIPPGGDFMTNDASKGMSSPINLLCNFVKTHFVSSVVMSINQIFFRKQPSIRNDCSELTDECIEMRNIGQTEESKSTVTESDAISAENGCLKEGIERKSDFTFDANFNGDNSCLNSFFLSDQKDRSDNHSVRVPDLNCSLLLADLVTRTITRNTYKPPIDECLLSPREMVLGKINEGLVRDESDAKQMLKRHLLEKEVESPNSWFIKLNGYAKSMLHHLGLVKKRDSDENVQDIRHLFA